MVGWSDEKLRKPCDIHLALRRSKFTWRMNMVTENNEIANTGMNVKSLKCWLSDMKNAGNDDQ